MEKSCKSSAGDHHRAFAFDVKVRQPLHCLSVHIKCNLQREEKTANQVAIISSCPYLDWTAECHKVVVYSKK